jgi:hypothetical protein
LLRLFWRWESCKLFAWAGLQSWPSLWPPLWTWVTGSCFLLDVFTSCLELTSLNLFPYLKNMNIILTSSPFYLCIILTYSNYSKIINYCKNSQKCHSTSRFHLFCLL